MSKRKRNPELDAADHRMLDDLARGRGPRGAKRDSKAHAKTLAKYRKLLDAGLVEESGGTWADAWVTLQLTSKGNKARHEKSERVENPHVSLAQLGTMSEHGRVHELQVQRADGQVESHTWSGASRPVLLWSPKQRALVFVHGVKMPRPTVGNVPRDDGAAATFERFFGKRTIASREFTMPAVSLRELGRGVFVAYWTPLKWRRRVAEHKLGPRVRVWMGSAGGRKVYAVAGGNLRMTARGIEG